MLYLLLLIASFFFSAWLLQQVLRYVAKAEGSYWWCVGMIFANGIATAVLNAVLAKMIGNEMAMLIIAIPMNFLIFAGIIRLVTEVEWKEALLSALVATIVFVIVGALVGVVAAAMGLTPVVAGGPATP